MIRVEAKGLPNVEKGSLGAVDKNDVYVTLRLGTSDGDGKGTGKELRTEVKPNAGASATYDYAGGGGKDAKDAKAGATPGAGLTWSMTVGELLSAQSKLRVSVWDDNSDRKGKERVPDVLIGSASASLAWSKLKEGGAELSDEARLEHVTLLVDVEEGKKAGTSASASRGTVSVLLKAVVVKPAAAAAAPAGAASAAAPPPVPATPPADSAPAELFDVAALAETFSGKPDKMRKYALLFLSSAREGLAGPVRTVVTSTVAMPQCNGQLELS